MKTYNFDAFGNPVQTTATGEPRATMLYGGEVYDPAPASCYLPIRCHHPIAGRFTSPDIHAGEAAPPANLQRFGYSGQTPIEAADPA